MPLLVLAALIVGGVLFHRTNKGKHFFGWLARKTPVVGNLTVKTACATFCRTMEVLIGSGLTLTDSMDLAASNMGNIYYLEAIRDARALVAEGTPLRESLVRTGIFPPMVSNLVGVGEETGDLQSMMGKVADYYDEEVDHHLHGGLCGHHRAGHLPADDQHDQGIRQIPVNPYIQAMSPGVGDRGPVPHGDDIKSDARQRKEKNSYEKVWFQVRFYSR